MEKREVPLTTLKAGEVGIVAHIRLGHRKYGHRSRWEIRKRHIGLRHGHGSDWGFGKRLMDMGLTPGTKVTVVKSAPFHGPFEILVRGSRLALGRGMAERIFVEIAKE
jgi:DtxR family Mn-dependent transcriptional regulator